MFRLSSQSKILLGLLLILVGILVLAAKPVLAVEIDNLSEQERNARIYVQHCVVLDIKLDNKYTQGDLWDAEDRREFVTRNPSTREAPYLINGKREWLSCVKAAPLVKADLPEMIEEYLYMMDFSEEEKGILREAAAHNQRLGKTTSNTKEG